MALVRHVLRCGQGVVQGVYDQVGLAGRSLGFSTQNLSRVNAAGYWACGSGSPSSTACTATLTKTPWSTEMDYALLDADGKAAEVTIWWCPLPPPVMAKFLRADPHMPVPPAQITVVPPSATSSIPFT